MVGLLLFGTVAIMAGQEKRFTPGPWMFGLLLPIGCILFLGHVTRLSGRTLYLDDVGIFVKDKRGFDLGRLQWSELGRVTERRKMAQLALWDRSGAQRVLVDQQFKNFNLIRARILAEYAGCFTPKPLSMEFRNSPLPSDAFFYSTGALFFGWMSWKSYQQDQTGASLVLFCFAVAILLLVLRFYPQLRGPSVLFEDRIVVRHLLSTEELYRKDIDSVQIEDITNPKSGTKFSMVVLRSASGKKLKITSLYGSIPEIYLTLLAWVAER